MAADASGDKDEKLMAEVVLEYTECKLAMARKFRDGLAYTDILDFEKQLARIDRALAKEEKKLARYAVYEYRLFFLADN